MRAGPIRLDDNGQNGNEQQNANVIQQGAETDQDHSPGSPAASEPAEIPAENQGAADELQDQPRKCLARIPLRSQIGEFLSGRRGTHPNRAIDVRLLFPCGKILATP
jgi:hypothetical protein